MRLFIAADVAPGAQVALAQLQARLRNHSLPLRYTAPAAMHLTLHFLGETDPALLESLGAALQRVCSGHAVLNLGLADCGVFPDVRRPQVVWAGVRGDLAGLRAVRDALGRELLQLGLPLEARAFHPHLTLARTRRDVDPAALRRIGTAAHDLGELNGPFWQVDRIVLFQSDLAPGGSVYTELTYGQLREA